jgi:hypothetical protein
LIANATVKDENAALTNWLKCFSKTFIKLSKRFFCVHHFNRCLLLAANFNDFSMAKNKAKQRKNYAIDNVYYKLFIINFAFLLQHHGMETM